MKERKELIASCPSGNPDYQYYLKVEADQVLDAYEARIKELEASQPKWVSVKERLPEECESVLLYNNADNGYAIAWAEKINGVWEFCDGEYNYPTDCFTHWMPLPQPTMVTK